MKRWLILALLALPAGGQCTQTFTPATVGTSPFPGDSVNTAISNGTGTTVLCFASGTYGTLDFYGNNPSGVVTLQPAVGATVTGIGFNLNGTHNVLITGFSGTSNADGGLSIVSAGQGDSTNVTFSNNTINTGSILISLNAGTNANILIQGNTLNNHAATHDAAIIADRNTGCPNGIVIKNNHVVNPLSDGLSTKGADCGTQWIGNEIEGSLQSVCNASAGGDHCDGFQDNGGSVNQILDGNYFHNDTDCGLANDGTTNLTFTNNVCAVKIGDSSFAMQWTGNGITFKHNTVIAPGLNTNIGNTSFGQSTDFVETDNVFNGGEMVLNPGQTIGGTGWQNDYNLCFPADGSCTGAHSVSGTATFVGGSTPTTYAGFVLTAGSPGHAAADDGYDMGINVPTTNGGPWTTHTWASPSSLTWGNVTWSSGHTWATNNTWN